MWWGGKGLCSVGVAAGPEQVLRCSRDSGVVFSKRSADRSRALPTRGKLAGWRGEPGWLILPLRLFLGITFGYAGLQKLANPGYLDSSDPSSVAHQMLLLRHRSPIGFLLGLSTHAPTLVGLLIAFGELAVGIGALIGLWTRVAAVGGSLLSLTFFLSVSWNTTPYYYGSDIVFVFAWLVILGFGAGGVLSLDAWLASRARRDTGHGPEPATVAVDAGSLRKLCPRGLTCALAPDGHCGRRSGCPVFHTREGLTTGQREDLGRRRMVVGGMVAGGVGLITVLIAGLTAVVGRAVGGTKHPASPASSEPTPAGTGSTPSGQVPSSPVVANPSAPTSSGANAAPAGVSVGAAAAVAVGQAVSVTDPADGSPAWVVHTAIDTFVAFSAICTHAGCPVQYDPTAVQFVCPCHGGMFDARTGQVLQGPPPSPLPAIPVHVVNGQIRMG
jgi:thiosulfate dehydrogenase [quinone] large subunit